MYIYIRIYIYVCLFMCGWLCTLYDGLLWLREQPFLVTRALDLVVWLCIQGDCHRCILMLYCVHDHCCVIVLIHVTKWHWFLRVCNTYQCVLTLWKASARHNASMSIRAIYIDTKLRWCAIAHQTRNSTGFSPWKWGIPIVSFLCRKLGENSVWRAMMHLRWSNVEFPPRK